MPFANLPDVTLHYALEGDGEETVVLVNGLGDDLDTWSLQLPELLAAGYRVLRYDNRGVGQSGKPMGPYTSRLMADDAKHLVDSLGITDFHLVGVSMGGMIAQEYAISYGADLRSVTFGCTYAAPGPFCSRMFAMWEDLAPVMGVSFVMRDVTLWAFTTSFFADNPAEAAEFERAMRYVDQPVPAYLAQLAAIQTHDTRAELPALQVPTLVLAGEEDILIPVSLSRELQQLVPGSTWATTPGGHACLWEHPREFNRALIDFLDSQRRGTT
jgi:3-oxoadipate enol-lactonase